jgi:hypothetical protein
VKDYGSDLFDIAENALDDLGSWVNGVEEAAGVDAEKVTPPHIWKGYQQACLALTKLQEAVGKGYQPS